MLVLDFQTGNGNRESAFVEIHRRYAGLARHICFKILANHADAEDATQETMLRVFQGLPGFNGRYRLQPWVARIATNVSLDFLRARARRPQSADKELNEFAAESDDADEPSVVVERLFERERVRKILAELPEHHRDALVLRGFEGRSHGEIGNALGVTPPQAKALIHRAKGSFRRAWAREEERHRGLGILVPWLLAPFHVPDWLRRLFGSATAAAASATASPVVTTTVISAGERATAAAVVLVMAATVGAGTVALQHMSTAKADRQPTPVLAPSPVPLPAQLVVRPERAQPERANKHGHAEAVVPSPPVPLASATPSASPTPSPSPSLLPEPTDVTLAFSSDVKTDYRCGCGTSPVMTSTVDASDDSVASFSATIDQAGAADPTGEIAWALSLQQSSPNGKDHEMTFVLTTPDGPYSYTAQGAVVSSERTGWGGWILVFEGTYSISSGPTGPDGTVPGYGSYRTAVSLSWQTARVVDTSVTLIEDAASPSATPTPSASPTP
jgi:RNA polymerase sigma-70 factor (ECF subfamily)